MSKRIDLTGQRFGRLVVLEYVGVNKSNGNARWKCQCDCGTIKEIDGRCLRTKSSHHTVSCGCKKRLPKGEAAFNQTYMIYKLGAKRRNYPFLLSKKDFRILTSQNCYYCGAKPSNVKQRTISRGRKSNSGIFIYNGIDRLDNTKGYIPDNVVPCCFQCNRMKDVYSQEEFLGHVERILKHQLNK